MGERPRVLLVLVVGVFAGVVGCAVADEGTGIQPVVRPYRHRHQAEGSECPHGGEKDLDPLLTHHALTEKEREDERRDIRKKRRDIRVKEDLQFIKKGSRHAGEMRRDERR